MAEQDAVSWILEQAGRFPLLSKDEELIHARNVQAWVAIRDVESPNAQQRRIIRSGKRSYDRFYMGNLRLVIHIAKRYKGHAQHLDFSDLIQEGAFGLARAIELFDPGRGYKFSTYAYWWIRQGITRSIDNMDRTIRLPTQAVAQLTKLRRWIPQFAQEHHRKPTTAECAEHCGCTEATMRNYLWHNSWVVSLDAPVQLEGKQDTYLIDLMSDSTASPDELATVDMMLDRMADGLDLLDDTQKMVIASRYELNGKERKTFAVLGNELGCSREQARKIEQSALLRLRETIDMAA